MLVIPFLAVSGLLAFEMLVQGTVAAVGGDPAGLLVGGIGAAILAGIGVQVFITARKQSDGYATMFKQQEQQWAQIVETLREQLASERKRSHDLQNELLRRREDER